MVDVFGIVSDYLVFKAELTEILQNGWEALSIFEALAHYLETQELDYTGMYPQTIPIFRMYKKMLEDSIKTVDPEWVQEAHEKNGETEQYFKDCLQRAIDRGKRYVETGKMEEDIIREPATFGDPLKKMLPQK